MAEPTFRAIPILRIFDLAKAKEFYVNFLGFRIDWEHRFEERAPVYLQVARGDLVLHLSEHHGDCCPGATVYVPTTGLEVFHREITARGYPFMRPGIEARPGISGSWRSGTGSTTASGSTRKRCYPRRMAELAHVLHTPLRPRGHPIDERFA